MIHIQLVPQERRIKQRLPYWRVDTEKWVFLAKLCQGFLHLANCRRDILVGKELHVNSRSCHERNRKRGLRVETIRFHRQNLNGGRVGEITVSSTHPINIAAPLCPGIN